MVSIAVADAPLHAQALQDQPAAKATARSGVVLTRTFVACLASKIDRPLFSSANARAHPLGRRRRSGCRAVRRTHRTRFICHCRFDRNWLTLARLASTSHRITASMSATFWALGCDYFAAIVRHHHVVFDAHADVPEMSWHFSGTDIAPGLDREHHARLERRQPPSRL